MTEIVRNVVTTTTAQNGVYIPQDITNIVSPQDYTQQLASIKLGNTSLTYNNGYILNLANANTWTVTQTFADIVGTNATLSGTLGITGLTTTAGITDSVSVTTPIINSTAIQTTITGTTAGSLIISMPEQGSSYKKVIIYASGYENDSTTAQTYTYPTAFVNTPVITTNSGTIPVVTTTGTTLSIAPNTTTLYTGFIIIEGY